MNGEKASFTKGGVWAGIAALLITLGAGLLYFNFGAPGTPAWAAGEKAPSAARVDLDSLAEKMTRTKKLYSLNSFDTLLDVRVLYKSPALRSAYVEDFSATNLLGEEQKTKLKQAEEQAAQEGEEFLIAVFTTDETWSDLGRKDPVWRLYLYDDQNRRVEPKVIQKTSISSAKIWKFDNYVSPWTKLYLVTFPKNLPPSVKPLPQPAQPAPQPAQPAPQPAEPTPQSTVPAHSSAEPAPPSTEPVPPPAEPLVGPDTKQIKLVFVGGLGRAELGWKLK